MPQAETALRARPKKPNPRKREQMVAWVLFFVLLLTAYLFWVLPHQLPPPRINVTFEKG